MNSLCTNSNQTTSVDITQYCAQPSLRSLPKIRVQKRTPTWLVRFISTGKEYLVRKYNQRIDRQAFDNLLTLDDDLLKDIGVTRQDVIYASNQPRTTDASALLNEIARRR